MVGNESTQNAQNHILFVIFYYRRNSVRRQNNLALHDAKGICECLALQLWISLQILQISLRTGRVPYPDVSE